MKIENNNKENILFVDDSSTSRAMAKKILSDRYTFIEATNGEEAWLHIEKNADIEFVFADIQMPKQNGFDLLHKIRSSHYPHIANIPVVIITGTENSEAAMRVALDMGATDFIAKPFRKMDLLSRTYSYLKLNKKIRKLETSLACGENTQFYLSREFETYARRCLSFARRHKQACSFANIEIDILSDIYTQQGKNALNKSLLLISKRLKSVLRKEDYVAQLSTNRFGVVLPVTSQVKSTIVAQKLLGIINATVLDIDKKKYRLSAKMAIFATCSLGYTYEDITRKLDVSLTQGRRNGTSIITCDEKSNVKEIKDSEVSEMLFTDALIHILTGNYYKIQPEQISQLSKKLKPFIEYADSQNRKNATSCDTNSMTPQELSRAG